MIPAFAVALLAAGATAPRPTPRHVTPATSLWRVEKTVSRMDDSRGVVLSLRANESIRAWPGKVSQPSLVLRCKEGKVDAYVVTGARAQPETGGSDLVTASIRVDAAAPEEVIVSESTDGEALFFPEAKETIVRLSDAKRLLFRFTPFNSSPQETSFRLTGLAAHLGMLEEACRWDRAAEAAAKKAQEEAAEQAARESEHRAELAKAVAREKSVDQALMKLTSARSIDRASAVELLSIMHRYAQKALPALDIAAATDEDPKVRSDAAAAAAKIRSANP